MMIEPTRVGRRGTLIIPAALRRRFGMEDGTFVIAEEREDGILLRPTAALPVESYSPERKAEFLLNNAVTQEDYAEAVAEVRRMGLDPALIPHDPPPADS